MKKLLALVLCGVIFISGCSVSPAQIIAGIDAFGGLAITDALKEVPNQDAAKKDAEFVSIALKTDIIPFVQNGTLPASQLVPQLRKLLGAKLVNTPYVGITLSVLSFAVANVDIKAPTMTDNEKNYILSACNAIVKGCDDFAAGTATTISLPYKISE